MITVGCDFGLRKSGIVLLDENSEIVSQNLLRVNQKVKGAERLVQIENGFDSIIKPFIGEGLEVFIEGYAYGAKYQRESLAELGGIMRRYLFLNGLNFWIIPPTSLKAYVTGTGKASKNYMKKCTRENWQQVFKSDDVCDAYGMARLGTSIVNILYRGKQVTLEEHQQNVINDVLTNQEFYKNSNTAKKRRKNDRKKETKSRRHN